MSGGAPRCRQPTFWAAGVGLVLEVLVVSRLVPAALGLKMRILSEASEELRSTRYGPETRKVGDGFGRALYQINYVEMPNHTTGNRCITARMDKYTHSLQVDEKEADQNSIAWACYNDIINQTGWATLVVTTTSDTDVPLQVRAYTAGLVEGLLTAPRIGQFHKNVVDLLKKDTNGGAALMAVDRVLRMSLIAWEEFAGGDAHVEPKSDLTKQAWAALLQLRGIRDGNNLLSEDDNVTPLSAYQVMMTNMHAEIPGIVELYGRSEQAKLLSSFMQPTASADKPGENGWPRWAAHAPKGSAIVRRVGTMTRPDDMLSAHVTFGEYGEMIKIMKTYKLHFGTLINDVTMSSYPGCVSSTDDYFITGRGFVLMSTSLWLPSSGEYSKPAITNDGLPSFLRAIMATRLATAPRMWAKVYGYIPGIAGAKQWVVADYSKFKALQPIANDTVWMVESLPRVQRANDVSHILRDSSFFEAHGVPHFADIRKIYGLPPSGPGAYEEMRGAALIDKGATINNLATARQMLREVRTSRHDQIPITARSDLDPSKPIPAGGTDAKATNKCLVQKMGTQAVSGPPLMPGGSPFRWKEANGKETFPGWPHSGVPDEWNFDWVSAVPGVLQPVTPELATCEQGAT